MSGAELASPATWSPLPPQRFPFLISGPAGRGRDLIRRTPICCFTLSVENIWVGQAHGGKGEGSLLHYVLCELSLIIPLL